jgi:endonuclease YncB( thermonuclease family)
VRKPILSGEDIRMLAQVVTTLLPAASRRPFVVGRVVDGDTISGAVKEEVTLTFPTVGEITVDVWLPVTVRLRHVNTPEKNTEAGKTALGFVVDWLSHAFLLELEYDGTREKYGRLLGVIYAGDTTLQQALLDANLAKPYEGGKR